MRPQRRYSWPHGKQSAFLFSVDVDVESPLAWNFRGKALATFGELEQRRFGARVGLSRLLDLLHEHGIKGSFYVPGMDAEAHPDMLPSIFEQGHELGLHGFHHENVSMLSDDENAVVMDRAIEVFRGQVGVSPSGYRSPSWELVSCIPEILKSRDILYDSSLMGYDHPYSIDGLTEVPVQWLTDDAIYFRFRGGAESWHPANPNAVFHSWIEEFEGIREYGGLFTLTVHPWISGRSQRLRLLRKLLHHVMGHEDVWIATAHQIAEHHRQSANSRHYEVSLGQIDTNF